MTRFFVSNLTRDETRRIEVLFLGRVISTPDGSLPWYNTLVWTVFVTPLGFLLLALVGVGRSLRKWTHEPFGLLVLGNWAFLLLLRSLPHTPGHGGVRQFLPAFGLLALSAGLGAAALVNGLGRWGRAIVALAAVEGLASVALMMPVPLSYFSPAVGGLPGATALGMEPTYYWDALNGEALAWLNAHTGPGEKVLFATGPTSWLYLREQGLLTPGISPRDPGRWAWYVLQNRPGAFRPLDRALMSRGKPAFEVRKLGIPLIRVYPFEQVEALMRGASRSPGPRMEPPTGPTRQAWTRGRVRFDYRGSLAGGVNLAARPDLGRRGRGGPHDRGRGLARGGGPGDRGRLLVVEEAAELHLVTAAEEAALLRGRGAGDRGRLADRGGRRAGLAHRRGRRARLANHDRRAGRGRGGALLLVTGLRVGGHDRAEEARQGQDQKLTSHGAFSPEVSNPIIETQYVASTWT
ncbi:MAG: hypothetical protein U0835_01730 [Isosphaeraceae bacterium]